MLFLYKLFFNDQNRPTIAFYVVLLLIAAVDVTHGRIPIGPVAYLIGHHTGSVVWPRFYRIKSTSWTQLLLFLFVLSLFVCPVAISIWLKPYGAIVMPANSGDAFVGLYFGFMIRAFLDKLAKITALEKADRKARRAMSPESAEALRMARRAMSPK